MDLIDRQAAIYTVDSETVSTNPDHFKSSEKFIKFMDDADIASFGKWQWANGFNTAVVAARIQLKNLPSAQKTGTWLVAKGACEPDYMECNHCGWITEYYGGLEEEWNYCPHCGARMERE